MKNSPQKRIIPAPVILLMTILAAFGLTLSFISVVSAASITVNTTADELNSDGDCSLREAIQSANTDTSVDNCTAGSGDDVITLPSGTYTLSVDQLITDNLTINGAGANITIIDRNATSTTTTTRRVFYVDSGVTLNLNNLTIQNGHAAGGDDGGGIYNDKGTLIISGCIITNNSANNSTDTRGGGGIYNYGGTVIITNSLISNNYTSRRGGGIANEYSGVLTVTNSTFMNNEGEYGGGINLFKATRAVIIGCTFVHNHATIHGGGFNVREGVVTLANSTVYSNTSPQGGGIAVRSTLIITNSTIMANNTYTTSNATLYCDNCTNITLTNTIIANEINAHNCYPPVGAVHDGGHNLEDANDCGFTSSTSLTNTNPLLGPLADNGGKTKTLALLAGSPAIDAGDNTACSTSPVSNRDQRGMTRPTDGDGDSTNTCDIGAYEAGEMHCFTGTGTITFTSQSSVSIQITDTGTNLGCIFVDEKPTNHPYATGSGTMTGKYWTINGLQSDGSTTATADYTLTMTLPHSVTPHANAYVCKYPGTSGGYGWDCARTSSTTSTVTRSGISSLSDWAVGDHVGPTAISLDRLAAHSNNLVFLVILLSGLAVFVLAGQLLRRRLR